jgi:hypothetical protein
LWSSRRTAYDDGPAFPSGERPGAGDDADPTAYLDGSDASPHRPNAMPRGASVSQSVATGRAPEAAPESNVSLSAILRFYLPLVLNSQLMTLSGPVINLAVGRAADPKLELAGYWIGFTILLFLESACFPIQSSTAALARGYQSLRRLLVVALTVSISASIMVLLVAKTPVGDPIFDHVIRTTPRVEALARTVLGFLAPVPILVGLRAVANGLAIREKRTILIARATLFRLLAISTIVGIVVYMGTGSGALAGVTAFVSGIALEAAVIWYGVWPHWKRHRAARASDREHLSFAVIGRVAAPLVVSAFAWTLFRPLVNGILGRLDDPELAQAGFGVVMPLVLLTSSPLWTLQNVTLMLPESRRELGRVLRFGALTAAVFSGILVVLTLSPLADIVLRRVFALSDELEATVRPALALIALEPLFLAVRSMSQGLLMRAKRTGAFAVFAPVKTVLVLGVGFAVAHSDPGVNGALLGTLLFLGADCFEAIAYGATANRIVRDGHVFDEKLSIGPRTAARSSEAS